jgi:hypothetical protein
MRKKKIIHAISLCLLLGSSQETLASREDLHNALIVNVDKNASAEKQKQWLEQLLVAGKIVVLQGHPDELEAIRPSWIQLWPKTDSIALSMRAGLGIYGISDLRDAPKDVIQDFVLNNIRWPAPKPYVGISGTVPTKADPISANIQQTIRPAGPRAACEDFTNAVYNGLFKDRPPTKEQLDATVKEAARWCQYGGFMTASTSGFTVPLYEISYIPQKRINFEWALIRNQNLLSPERSTQLFWSKSTSEGAGQGFTRNSQDTAFWRDNIVRNLFDIGIHSGWGVHYVHDPASWALPENGEHWPSKDHRFFQCDMSSIAICPKGVQLIRLFPKDTFDNTVTVASSTSLSLGGTATLTPGIGPTGPSFTAAFALSATHTETQTRTAELSLTTVRTNATPTYSRSTRWRPNVAAVWDWVTATRPPNGGQIGNATPLAATLSPEYDVLWEIPIKGNENKLFRYSIISEAGVNHCVRTTCATRVQPPDRSIPPQKRIGWNDEALIQLQP